MVSKISFMSSLLLAPLAYAIHHAEEHLIFSFREWRLEYFADNNPLSTEAVFLVLTGITMIYLFLHSVLQTSATAKSAILFLMATQVVNALFHAGGTAFFNDFSPGLITGLTVYLPVNALICRQALREGWVTRQSLLVLFVLGAAIFTAFEAVGPFPMFVVLLTTYAWIAYTPIQGSERVQRLSHSV